MNPPHQSLFGRELLAISCILNAIDGKSTRGDNEKDDNMIIGTNELDAGTEGFLKKKDLQGKEVESMQMISYDIHCGGVRGIQSPGEVTETKASFVHFFPGHPTACPKSLSPDLAKECK